MSSTALTRTPTVSSQLQGTSSQQLAPTQKGQGTSSQQQQTPSNVRTPQQMLERPSATSVTPGKWEHPRMAEIRKRRQASTFNQANVTRIIFSLISLLLSWMVPQMLIHSLPSALLLPVPNVLPMIVRAILCINIAMASAPLFKSKDNMEDVPLTPQQRKLLDLPPMSRPATPQEQAAYVTPPRYSRNNTPNSLDSLKVNARGSPLSARGTPRDLVSSSSTSTSIYGTASRVGGGAYTGSPLGRTPDLGQSRRDSLGSGRGSPLAVSDKDLFGSPASRRASTGLNNKWLYDRSKPSAVTPSGLLGAGWGTGSVFN